MATTAPHWLIEEICKARKGRGVNEIVRTTNLLGRHKLATVCQSALCPNRGECFSDRTATFLILGDICTRGCKFCAINFGQPSGLPDENEPARLAKATKQLNLQHVVITSVTRDDLADGVRGIMPGLWKL